MDSQLARGAHSLTLMAVSFLHHHFSHSTKMSLALLAAAA